MALPNLSGSNIQDTYQRVLHTDGGTIYDGTGSVLLSSSELTSLQVMGSAGITSTEWLEIANIGSADISADEWGYVATGQAHGIADSPAFKDLSIVNMTASGNISSSGLVYSNESMIGGIHLRNHLGNLNLPGAGLHIANDSRFDANITASGDISSSGILRGLKASLGDTEIVTQTADLHIRNVGSTNVILESTGNNNTFLYLKNNQSPDFNIANMNNDGGFQINSELKNFLTIGAGDGDEIKASGSLNVTGSNGNITASGNISASGVIYSDNEEVLYNGSFRASTLSTVNWVGPDQKGPTDYTWDKDYGVSGEGSHTMAHRYYLNAGHMVPYDCILTGFQSALRNHSAGDDSHGALSMSLFYRLDADMDWNDSGANQNTNNILFACGNGYGHGDTIKAYNSYKVEASCAIHLTKGSMIYPRIARTDNSAAQDGSGTGGGNTDGTYNIFIKRRKS